MPGAGAESAEKNVSLRVMTYNIHSCKGRDGKIRPDRIAKVIEQYSPDIVALQEVRVGRVDPKKVGRSGNGNEGEIAPPVGEPPLPPPSVVAPRPKAALPHAEIPYSDQPRSIAQELGMYYIFYPLVRMKQDDYGIALLSKHPIKLVRASTLPQQPNRKLAERRGALWAEVLVDGVPIQVLNTHLGLNREERMAQVEALLNTEWLGSEKFTGPFVLSGDFNARPSEPAYKRLAEIVVDAPYSLKGDKTRSTWPTDFPIFRIDHVFIPKTARATAVEVPKNSLTRASSDHLPLIVDLVFPRG